MRKKTLHQAAGLTWTMFARDPQRSSQVIDTNEYLIIAPDNVVMMDPGGTEIFPPVVAAVSEVIAVDRVKTFVCSHQDPDIMSSLPLWMGLCPGARVLMPWLWTGFVAHFGHEYAARFVPVPDEGTTIPLGGGLKDLVLVPAHYCHSSGNFSLYDPNARILFTGDIGAALLPEGSEELVVADFASHVKYMEGFHRRWMPSNEAKNQWVARVRKLDVKTLCPQHGAVMEGPDVARFLDWLEGLQVGGALEAGRAAGASRR
ncbi:MAG: MBL fold metallo-hydrolase [Deltaproteobacteria bacterium]|nr:MBL fold metallo-hydrolase [Deltaproteobacteria bacterium]